MMRFWLSLVAALMLVPSLTLAQNGPLRIEITDGVIEPLPFAVPDFVSGSADAVELGLDTHFVTVLLFLLQISVLHTQDENRAESEGLQTLSRRSQSRDEELTS